MPNIEPTFRCFDDALELINERVKEHARAYFADHQASAILEVMRRGDDPGHDN